MSALEASLVNMYFLGAPNISSKINSEVGRSLEVLDAEGKLQ